MADVCGQLYVVCGRLSVVGWVKRNTGTISVGFAYFVAPQPSEIESKLANPTRFVADHRLNPTYDLSLRPTKPFVGFT